MKLLIKKYALGYLLASVLFCLLSLLEHSMAIRGIVLWFLSYLLLRKVSFKIIIVLSLVADLLSARTLGTSGFFYSLLLIITSFNIAVRRLTVWSLSFVGIGILLTLGGAPPGVGFVLVSSLMFPLFVFGLPRRVQLKI